MRQCTHSHTAETAPDDSSLRSSLICTRNIVAVRLLMPRVMMRVGLYMFWDVPFWQTACDHPSATAPTAVVVVAPATQVETFATTLTIGGSRFYSFAVNLNGTVEITLTSVSGIRHGFIGHPQGRYGSPEAEPGMLRRPRSTPPPATRRS